MKKSPNSLHSSSEKVQKNVEELREMIDGARSYFELTSEDNHPVNDIYNAKRANHRFHYTNEDIMERNALIIDESVERFKRAVKQFGKKD